MYRFEGTPGHQRTNVSRASSNEKERIKKEIDEIERQLRRLFVYIGEEKQGKIDPSKHQKKMKNACINNI